MHATAPGSLIYPSASSVMMFCGSNYMARGVKNYGVVSVASLRAMLTCVRPFAKAAAAMSPVFGSGSVRLEAWAVMAGNSRAVPAVIVFDYPCHRRQVLSTRIITWYPTNRTSLPRVLDNIVAGTRAVRSTDNGPASGRTNWASLHFLGALCI